MTFIKNGNGDLAGLVQLLTSQCIECTDTLTGERISIFTDKESPQQNGTTVTPPDLMVLEPQRTNYVTFTNDPNPRSYEFEFISDNLQPNHTYTILCAPASLTWWTYNPPSELITHFSQIRSLPPSSEPPTPLSLNPTTTTTSFATRPAMAKAPHLSISLSAPPTFSLSGTQPPAPFEYDLTFTSHAPYPITIRYPLHHCPTSVNTEIAILDVATREQIAPDLVDIDDADADEPLTREDFLQLMPWQGYVVRRVLDPRKAYSGLGDLVDGTDYVLCMKGRRWWWSYDDVDEILAEEGRGRGGVGGLRPVEMIEAIASNEVRFCTVK